MLSAKRGIKAIFGHFGLEIRKISPPSPPAPGKFAWLKEFRIHTVLDIGANTGQFVSSIFGQLPEARVYSFEPLRDVYEALVKNCGAVKGFKGFNIALGDVNGWTKMNRSEFSPSSSLLKMGDLHKALYPYTAGTQREEIEMMRLDDFITREGVNLEPEVLIKMDVQGYEDRVLNGCRNTLERTKVVITEVSFCDLYEEQASFRDIYGQMQNSGFVFKGILEPEYDPVSGKPIFGDAIFVRESSGGDGEKRQGRRE